MSKVVPVEHIYECVHRARMAMTDALVMGNLARIEELDRHLDVLLTQLLKDVVETNPSRKADD